MNMPIYTHTHTNIYTFFFLPQVVSNYIPSTGDKWNKKANRIHT